MNGNNSNKRTMRLGDRVSGVYWDKSFAGVIAGFSGAYVSIDLDTPTAWGSAEESGEIPPRTGLALDRRDPSVRLTVTAEGPALEDNDVEFFQGHVFLRTGVAS